MRSPIFNTRRDPRLSKGMPGLKPLAAALMLALPVAAIATPSQAQTQVGSLRCNVSAGLGAIIASSRDMYCTFRQANGRVENYRGTIRRFGLDIGATRRGVLVWGVVAPTRGLRRGALAGEYTGASAEATVGAGVGANALIGGSDRSFSLQPVSVQGQTGLNLAAGVAQLTLRSVPPRRR
jgi:hypothetical protein